jgi:hypothetical protein
MALFLVGITSDFAFGGGSDCVRKYMFYIFIAGNC